MATGREKPACLIVCSAHQKGVSAQSFIHSFTLTSSAFNVFLATPGGAGFEFVGVDETNSQWVKDFRSKPITANKLEEVDSSRFVAVVIPSAPGALFDLASNQMLGTILNAFVLEKKPVCAIGYGVAGLFSTLDKHTQHWGFQDFSMTAPPLAELSKRDDFASLPLTPAEFIRNHRSTYSAAQLDNHHVIVDSTLVTGQNEQSTLTAVQNLILLSNARLTRPR